MANYQEPIVKLTNTQLKKSEAENNTGTIWTINEKAFQDK